MQAELILLHFLECQTSPSSEYRAAVRSLSDEIGKDGVLESDGHLSFRAGSLEVDGGEPDAVDDEVCRRIGAQLAQMGDQFELEGLIKKEVVESVVNAIVTQSLTPERFGAAVRSLMDKAPPGLEQEKASALLAVKLTDMVGRSVPGLLSNCFTTACDFIRGNAYLQQLAGQR
ncbi:BH3-interacting domain death agonist [Gastrophryne carolinensis]